MGNFNDTLTGNLKSEIDRLSQYAKDLEEQATGLNHENLSLSIRRNEDVDVQTLANSVADVLGISLLREISVTFNVAVEATMLVPSDFDISDFDVTDVRMEAWNSEVDDFSVQSFEISDVEEA